MADDLFPSIDDSDVEDFEYEDPSLELLEEDIENEPVVPYGFSWQFDFSTGDIAVDGRGEFTIIEEHAVLRDWIGHTLNTERYETSIFGTDIGTDIPHLIGNHMAGDSQTLAEVEAEIHEAILVHDRIEEVYMLGAFALGHDIFAGFQYTTDDSTMIQEVVVL